LKSMELYLEHQPFDGSQLCAQVDPELFFPEEYDNVHEAKAVCRSCPLTTSCLEYAMAHPELEGIWGATTPHERRLMRRRKRARA
jgi:WhiB family redox-sensing transcriptional regulator